MRVVAAGRCEPADALALDEAVVRAEPRNPVLILWHTRPAVVIGRFQRADWEVDPVACAERRVDVWRRFTGGGAVHLDPGTLCIGRVVPAGHPDAALGVPDLYAPFLTGIAAACRALSIEATVDGAPCTSAAEEGDGRRSPPRPALRRSSTARFLVDADLDALVAHRPHPLFGRRRAVVVVGAEHLELAAQVSDPDAEHQPVTGEAAQRSRHRGHDQRMTIRGDQDVGAEPQPGGRAESPRTRRHRLQERRREVHRRRVVGNRDVIRAARPSRNPSSSPAATRSATAAPSAPARTPGWRSRTSSEVARLVADQVGDEHPLGELPAVRRSPVLIEVTPGEDGLDR